MTLRVKQLKIFEVENKIFRQRFTELKWAHSILMKLFTDLEAENAELESRLNSNHMSSIKPPLSDGYKKKHAFSGTHILRELKDWLKADRVDGPGVLRPFFMTVYEMPFEERVKSCLQLAVPLNPALSGLTLSSICALPGAPQNNPAFLSEDRTFLLFNKED